MQLQVFDFEGRGVEVIDRDGQLWLKGVQVAEALGYKNPRAALAKHVHEDDKVVVDRFDPSRFATGPGEGPVAFQGGASSLPLPKREGSDDPAQVDDVQEGRQLTLINESGLWTLVLRSRLAVAVRFQRWLTIEVLPSLRRTGAYVAPGNEGRHSMTPLPELAARLADEAAAADLADPANRPGCGNIFGLSPRLDALYELHTAMASAISSTRLDLWNAYKARRRLAQVETEAQVPFAARLEEEIARRQRHIEAQRAQDRAEQARRNLPLAKRGRR